MPDSTQQLSNLQLSSAAAQRSDGVLPLPASPLPRFAWRTVVTFAANPAAFLVIPLLFRFAPGLDVLGANWATDRMALRHGLVGTAPLLALSKEVERVGMISICCQYQGLL